MAACGNDNTSDYEVIEDDLKDSGMQYLTVTTEVTEQKQLESIVQSLYGDYQEADSVNIYITKPGDDMRNPATMSGMRRGEVVALQWPVINCNDGYILLTRSIPFFEDGQPHI